MTAAILIYPHQLYKQHPAFASGADVYLIEDPLFFGNDPHWPTAMHQQKLMLHRASMKAYAEELRACGRTIHYIEVPFHSTTDSKQLLEENLPVDLTVIHLADPADDILMRRVRRYALSRGVEVIIYASPNFVTPPDFLETNLSSRKKPFMAKFYENQRKRMNLLLEADGSALGGKWSFDTENRLKLPKNHTPPREPVSACNAFSKEAASYISRKFPNNPGSPKTFRWPVTRKDSEAWLNQFIDERLANFGLYEDAISTRRAYLYHSAITPMLNIGLLDPQDVIDRVIEKAAQREIPMNSLEGFIRQVIGWREFMHGIYQSRGMAIRKGNFWNFTHPMPRSFYDGTTGIPPVDRVIRQLLTDGYCHHIERLMVLGNFMVLCRIKPDDVYRWFMEMFVDSYDWVMVPNVYGMSQYADGGTFTTKPYIS
ncbi:MAG: cryptochrome/photolyase family protein, partial [Verrucomicrobia bacterium]|nr:cryptochrome/photolyase family protein [Verrucomicrobiota bacterium]